MIIGYSPGGGYDLYARVLSQHMGRHIPGNPTLIPQNMPGAGSLKAALYLYSVAPKDGSVIGTFARGMGSAPLIGHGDFDARKFNWLGSVTRDTTRLHQLERLAHQNLERCHDAPVHGGR